MRGRSRFFFQRISFFNFFSDIVFAKISGSFKPFFRFFKLSCKSLSLIFQIFCAILRGKRCAFLSYNAFAQPHNLLFALLRVSCQIGKFFARSYNLFFRIFAILRSFFAFFAQFCSRRPLLQNLLFKLFCAIQKHLRIVARNGRNPGHGRSRTFPCNRRQGFEPFAHI